ncbi:MAG: alpha/beta hydrolase [Novosphingobium sp.]
MNHFIRPDVQFLLQKIRELAAPSVTEVGPEGARDMMRRAARLDLPEVPLPVRRDWAIPGPGGDPLPLRLYDSRESRESSSALLYFHGGGFVIGDLDSHASLCSHIAKELDLPVIAVDYRLAPEHPWPAGPDDCEAAARWIASSPAELGFTVSGLVFAGDSAGGALAAVTAMALRDEAADVPVICQWLIYPTVDLGSGSYRSLREFAKGYFLETREIVWFNGLYAPDAESWRASPIKGAAPGLPPAVIHTASLDPLRDQGRAYAARLAEAGVPILLLEAEGVVHNFAIMRAALPSVTKDLAKALAGVRLFLRQA